MKEFSEACLSTTSAQTQKHRHLIDLMGICAPKPEYKTYMKLIYVVDFVSGMTDRYALGMYRQIQGITSGSITPASVVK